MGIVLFFMGLGFVSILVLGVVFIISLLFGSKDPYEEELKQMDFEDAMLARRDGDTFTDVDAGNVHIHK